MKNRKLSTELLPPVVDVVSVCFGGFSFLLLFFVGENHEY